MIPSKTVNKLTSKPVKFSNLPALVKLPLLVPPRSLKEELDKLKFYGKSKNKTSPNYSYAQASSESVKEILKIKEIFSQLLSKKIEDVHKVINNPMKPKPYINITTKKPLWKQIIISIDGDNIAKFMRSSSDYVININWALKGIKFKNFIDFIHANYWGLIVTSNKIASQLDLSVVDNYIKNSNLVDIDNVQSAHLPQSKFYLKILGIPYFIEGTNTLIDTCYELIP